MASIKIKYKTNGSIRSVPEKIGRHLVAAGIADFLAPSETAIEVMPPIAHEISPVTGKVKRAYTKKVKPE